MSGMGPDDLGHALSPAARSILDAARFDEDPSADRLDRVRGRMMAQLGLAVAAGTATATLVASTAEAAGGTALAAGAALTTETAISGSVVASSAVASSVVASSVVASSVVASSAAAATVAPAGAAGVVASLGFFAKLGAATKVGLAVLALGGATTGVIVVGQQGSTSDAESSRSPAELAAPAAPQVARSRSTANGAVTAAPPPTMEAGPAAAPSDAPAAPSSSEHAATTLLPANPSPAATTPPAARARPTEGTGAAAPSPAVDPPAVDPPAVDPPAVDPLAEETALLGEAQRALAAGRSAHALRLLEEHARRFPAGVLAPEREGARWLALCGTGRADQVRAAVTSFLAANPGSPLAARLRATCGIAP